MPRCVVVVARRDAPGFGLTELLVALLLFTTGMLGLLSGQLAGQRSTHAALQRTVALAYAQDLLARIESNPGALAQYVVTGLGADVPEAPGTDCRHAPCTPAELARFDLWRVATLLQSGGDGARVPRLARLPGARACVERAGEQVTVALSWLGHAAGPGAASARCGAGEAPRREVALSTWVVASP